MISDVEIENEIRALVADFLEGMRALARKDVLRTVGRHLQVDIGAAGSLPEPAKTPTKPGRKRASAPAPSRAAAPTAPARGAPARPARGKPARGTSRKKAAAPRGGKGAALPAPASRAPASRAPKAKAASARQPVDTAGEKAPEPAAMAKVAAAARPEGQPAVAYGNEIADALLAHVEIEPGQGIEELALAMGTPATELQEPIKQLLAENKITEEQDQGQTSYYPT